MRCLCVALVAVVSAVAFTKIAAAGDVLRRAPATAPPPPAAYNWTGFYVGGNVGGGWGRRNVDYSPNDPGAAILLPLIGLTSESFDTSGVIGGVQAGYNYQINRKWLVGLEADFEWSGMKGSDSTSLVGGLLTAPVDEHIKWFGTVRARLGYLPADNLLTYVTGGFAYGQVERTGTLFLPAGVLGISVPSFSATCTGPAATCFAGSSRDTALGWTLGGGLEYAFWQKWTIKAEYLYVSLDNTSLTETATLLLVPGTSPVSYDASSRANFNVARVGVNYRF
jgi:outer membrane immunogenic protein